MAQREQSVDSANEPPNSSISTLNGPLINATNIRGKHEARPDAVAKGRDITNRALYFLSTASNESLGVCGLALAAITYLVLGRVGLVLIGAVGGILLHATWDGLALDVDSGTTQNGLSRRRKETGIEVAKRLLDWRGEREKDAQFEIEDVGTLELDYSTFKPQTGAALTLLTDAIIRDYVKWWYGPIIPTDNAFPASCRRVLTSFILSFSNHISRKRPADTFLEFLTNSSSIVIVFLNELSAALMSAQGLQETPTDAVQRYLQQEPESSLANALSAKQQEKKLTLVADDILHNFLDRNTYTCDPAKVFLRQILAQVILEMTIKNCSKPEFINGWIVYLLEEGEPEFLEAIDAGVEGMKGVPKTAETSQREEVRAKKLSDNDSRRVSRAQEAMDEAMAEAQRLSEMIAREEALRQQQQAKAESETGESTSTATTEGIATPTSTDSDRNGNGERSVASSMVLGQSAARSDPRPSTPPRPQSPTSESAETIETPGPTSPRPTSGTSQLPTDQSDVVFTLRKATVSIFDDASPDDKSIFRAKPTGEFLIQIEPASSRFPGWMISRKYTDFEALHEVLRRISVIAGVSEFSNQHTTLPTWKGQSKMYLRQNLERYLQHALRFEQLAESEGMKKFLEKDTGMAATPASKNPFGFIKGPVALENVGKGFVDVLGNANKGITGGGKAVLGGVQGVFGAVGVGIGGPKRTSSHTPSRSIKSSSVSSLPRSDSHSERSSNDRIPPTETMAEIINSPIAAPPMKRAESSTSELKTSPGNDDIIPEALDLPPPPSSIDDDYGISKPAPQHVDHMFHASPGLSEGRPSLEVPSQPPASTSFEQKEMKSKTNKTFSSLSEDETRVAVELFFAIINELYSLSSAWNIRLTLLSAAKTFLLRPGNPNLESIRILIQDSVIESNFSSDEGVAAHILKIRENTLPTEEELRAWPPEPSPEEKEKLRVKARKLLVERGMPQALTSVMGTAASGEALGRVFDCLQIEEVARGLMFALLLQGVRAMTQ